MRAGRGSFWSADLVLYTDTSAEVSANQETSRSKSSVPEVLGEHEEGHKPRHREVGSSCDTSEDTQASDKENPPRPVVNRQNLSNQKTAWRLPSGKVDRGAEPHSCPQKQQAS